jgi:fumarate hydratase subunit beta
VSLELETPLSLEDIRGLEAGDKVYLSGTVYTARDMAHLLLCAGRSPVSLEGAALYHCGPLMKGGRVLSAGPTTSGRMARYTEKVLSFGVRAIIGKGGLPAEPFAGRAVYLAYPGGCGAAAGRQLKLIRGYFEELGMAEALWELKAERLGPMTVAIDSYGKDLYRDVRASALSRLKS